MQAENERVELQILSRHGSMDKRPESPMKALKITRRQESFNAIRENAANIGLRLCSQFSGQSPTRVKRMISYQDDPLLRNSGRDSEELGIDEEGLEDETSLLDNFCQICYMREIVTGDKPVNEQTFEFSCKHRFCRPCCEETLRPQIINNALHKLKCPESSCMKVVCDEDLKKLFSKEPEILLKLEKWRSRATEISNELLRYCTKPRCEGKIIAESNKVKYVTCHICGTQVCFECRDTWHKGMTCQQNMEWIYQHTYGKKKNVSFCPMCKTRIERTKGCNHMTCGFCRYEFCWVCHRGATGDSDHWNEFSLTGCGAK